MKLLFRFPILTDVLYKISDLFLKAWRKLKLKLSAKHESKRFLLHKRILYSKLKNQFVEINSWAGPSLRRSGGGGNWKPFPKSSASKFLIQGHSIHCCDLKRHNSSERQNEELIVSQQQTKYRLYDGQCIANKPTDFGKDLLYFTCKIRDQKHIILATNNQE